MRRFWIHIIIAISLRAASADVSGVAFSDVDRLNITPHVEVLYEQEHPLSLEQVLEVPASQFQRLGQTTLHLGLTNTGLWLRITVEAPERGPTRVLVLKNPRLGSVELYKRDANGAWQTSVAGAKHPFYNRELFNPEPSFLLNLTPGETHTLYLRVQHAGSLRFSVWLYRAVAFHYSVAQWTAYTFLLIGAFCAMGIYNLCIFFGLRERGYLYLAIFIAIFLLFQMSLSGVAPMYLWPNSPWWSDRSLTFLVMMAVVAAVFFSNEVLNAYKLSPWLARLALVFAGIAFLTGVGALTDWQGKYFVSHSLGFIMPALIMVLAVRCWRKGYRPAGFFVVAWGLGVLGTVMLSLLGPGWIPSNLVTEHLAELGFLAAIFLWSFTLTNRVSEKEEMQRATLETAVKERTAELEQSLADVKTLQGLLPMCSSCKKIRDDSGYWSEVEEYLSRHTDFDFSHGLCPECAIRLYPQYFTPKQ